MLDGARLIAIHRSKYFMRPDGLALGPGPFVAALECSTGVTAECVGKPEPVFFESALDNMNCTVEDTVMIGDVS